MTGSSLLLVWLAPADAPNGGGASAYDLRWSADPITDLNFAAATPLGVQPSPHSPGTLEAYGISGLASGATYHYAIRSQDAAGNWSTISNVVEIIASPDQTAPATITDLSAH